MFKKKCNEMAISKNDKHAMLYFTCFCEQFAFVTDEDINQQFSCIDATQFRVLILFRNAWIWMTLNFNGILFDKLSLRKATLPARTQHGTRHTFHTYVCLENNLSHHKIFFNSGM